MNASTIRLPLRKKARVEIIPLIDVIFFLLATFVLFTLSLNHLATVPVTLPVPGESKTDDSVRLQVSADGSVYWNQDLITLDELPARLMAYQKTSDDPRLLVGGDDKAHFGATVKVLDLIRKVGIQKFSIETRPQATAHRP